MNVINKLSISALALTLAVSSGVGIQAHAQTTTTTATTTASTSTLIADLLAQLQMLQARLAELQSQQATVRQEIRENIQLTRNLVLGMSGDDVTELQELLASDPEIYPEGIVSGYFGNLTEQAVKRLQAKFGIEQVGNVGPITRETLNQLFGKLNKGKGSLNRGPGNIFDVIEVDDDNNVDLSEFVPGTTGILLCHKPGGNVAKGKTIAVGGPAVQAHLRHGDTLGACDDDKDEDDDSDDDSDDEDEDDSDEDDSDDDSDDDNEEADTVAPEISNIESNVTSSTTVSISWNTNESADSTVWYSTDEGFDVNDSATEKESDSDNVTAHSLDLTDLTASTTYFFKVGSEDAEGNEKISSEGTFATE